ncbi:MAG: SPOR domain-containing protein [Chloracidobacterium sp.]|nr:SPOR domain-containing protein [Chloracidobacterium sp.]
MKFRVALIFSVLASLSAQNAAANTAFEYFRLSSEPLIRIGLATNAGSVTITTGDSSLVAVSPDEQPRLIASTRVTVSARAYRPPETEDYRIEFQGLPTRGDADDLAKDIREATGETAIASVDPASNLWKVWVGSVKESAEEADALKARLAEKDFDDAVVVVEKKAVVTPEAVALSQQMKNAGPQRGPEFDQGDRFGIAGDRSDRS